MQGEFDTNLRTVLDALPVVVALADKERRYRYVNQRFLDLMGMGSEEVLGQTAQDVLGEAYEYFSEAHERVLSGEAFSWSGCGNIKGRTGHMEFHYVPIKDQRGVVQAFGMFGWDVSKRVSAEQRLADILATSGDWIWEVDAQGRYTFVSGRCKDLLGYEPEEIIGCTPFDFMPREESDKVRSEFLAIVAELGSFRDLENWNRTKSGELVCIHTSGTPVLDSDGELVGYRGVDKDMTARKRSEEERERMRERLASLWKVARMTEADHKELSDLVVSETQRLTRSKAAFFGFVSPDRTALELHSWPRETMDNCMVDDRDMNFVIQEAGVWTIAVKEKRSLVVNDYDSWTVNKKGYPEGHVALARLLAVPVLQNGEVVALAAVANKETDYTQDDVHQMELFVASVMVLLDRRKAQEELRHALERAEAGNRSKGEFLATMSHEVRTPLNGVLGMLQLLELTELDEEQSGFVHSALESGRSLMRILSDILDFSRIEAGAMELADEPFSVEGLVKPVLVAFKDQAEAKELDLVSRVDPQMPSMLRGDAGRIRQIMNNLVGNAVKYTDHGSVTLEIYKLPAQRSDGSLALHISVKDTGVGIPTSKLETIFEVFTQVDGSFTRRHGGAGLGLSIVRRLTELMGGNLAITSEPGQGTEAHLTLWLKVADTEAAGPDTEREAGGMARSVVLLVDDDRVGRIATRGMLTKAGLTVIEATNGRQALSILSRERVDVVLMDVQMPIMDGVEAVRRIRAGKDGVLDSGVIVLALTAHAMQGDQERFLREGMDGVLSKPVEYPELLALLGKRLNQ